MEIRLKSDAVRQRIAELKSKLASCNDPKEKTRIRKALRSLKIKLTEMEGFIPKRKDYIIRTKFVFKGTFKVYATSKDEALQIVKESCGMSCGNIQATVPNVLDWDFDMTPTKIAK